MNVLTLDLETSFVIEHNGDRTSTNPSPHHPDNFIVSAGFKRLNDQVGYVFFEHTMLNLSLKEVTANRDAVQQELDWADLVVCHNAKFDMGWLLATGYKYDGKIWDTMIAEYVLNRGEKLDLSLAGSCKRRGCADKKKDLTEEYMANQISFEYIPPPIIIEYGMQDVVSTEELYLKQVELFNKQENTGLLPTLYMSFEFCQCLTAMERNGIAIDLNELNKIDEEYTKEYNQLRNDLEDMIKELMGDTPINIDSPEHLSKVIYSREIIDKKKWAETFNIGTEARGGALKKKHPPRMSSKGFIDAVRTHTRIVTKTIARQCPNCGGTGTIQKTKADGTEYKRRNICHNCERTGVVYEATKVVAGLRCSPTSPVQATDGGFATSRSVLELLSRNSSGVAREFIGKYMRYNAISTYRSTFVGGISRSVSNKYGAVYTDHVSKRIRSCVHPIINPQFFQCVTSTGRLSSRDPNFYNMPRASGFPIRGVIVSRWEGGMILEADERQLEFRAAVEMAGDEQGREDIAHNIDVHAFTRDTITAAGQTINRQDAKPHTFKPLYGGTTGTEAEQAYYKAFMIKYKGIADWQKKLQNEAIRNKKIVLPSGREYVFPLAKRLSNGQSTFRTQICNYPVQGFATGDIVPCCCIEVWKELTKRNLKSLLINSVYDSVVLDVHPDELDIAPKLVTQVMSSDNLRKLLKERYDYDLQIPLEVEIKMGVNWKQMKVVEPE